MKNYIIALSFLFCLVISQCSSRMKDYESSTEGIDVSSTPAVEKRKGYIEPNISNENTCYANTTYNSERNEYYFTPNEFLYIKVCPTMGYGEKDFEYFYRDVKTRLFIEDSEVIYKIKKDKMGCSMTFPECICLKLEPEINYDLPLYTKMRIDFDILSDLYQIGPGAGPYSPILVKRYSIYLNNTTTPDAYRFHITKPYYTKTTGIGIGFSQMIVADVNTYVEIALMDSQIKKAYLKTEEFENSGWTDSTLGLAFEYNGDDIIPEEISTIKIIGKIKDRYEDKVSEVIEYKPDSKMWIPVKHEDPKNRYEPYIEYFQSKCIKEFYFVK